VQVNETSYYAKEVAIAGRVTASAGWSYVVAH